MKTLLSFKKGQIKSILIVVLVLFVLAIILIFLRLLFDRMVTAYTNAGLVNDAQAQRAVAGFTVGMNAFDYITVILMVGMIITIGLLSYKLAVPRVFFIIMWIFAPILGAVSYFFNYIFMQIVSVSVFSTVLAYFPLTILICTNLHWVALLAIIVASITLYVKRDKGQFVGEQ